MTTMTTMMMWGRPAAHTGKKDPGSVFHGPPHPFSLSETHSKGSMPPTSCLAPALEDGGGTHAAPPRETDGSGGDASADSFVTTPEKDSLVTTTPQFEDEDDESDVRVAVIGNVDSGKSTLIGVLTSAALDDGRGAARSLVLRHRHERENGRTSAATVELLGFGACVRVVCRDCIGRGAARDA